MSWDVDCKLYPSYKTQGTLESAVKDFNRWLLTEIEILFDQYQDRGGINIVVVLLGHSMGGLLAADSSLLLADNFKKANEINAKFSRLASDNNDSSEASTAVLVDLSSPGKLSQSPNDARYQEERMQQEEQQQYPISQIGGTYPTTTGFRAGPQAPLETSYMCGFDPNDYSSTSLASLTPYRNSSVEIGGVLAYDTPFYGINNELVSDTAYHHFNTAKSWLVPAAAGAFALWADEKEQQEESKANSGNVNYNHPPASNGPGGISGAAMNGSTGYGGNVNSSTAGTASMSSGVATDAEADAKHEKNANRWKLAKWGALALGAAGLTAAYVHRKEINAGVDYLMGHLLFAKSVFITNELEQRMNRLMQRNDIFIHCFYNQLTDTKYINKRCFISLPPQHASHLFSAIPSNAEDEITAHKSMFSEKTNVYIYDMGTKSIDMILNIVGRRGQE
ncbi:hypothetical protein H4219_000085 [Mycoemilia scoparia]|uniref:GPI inositol-deacylase n=1 Tax=Mycoemilia scoparia TaxID=417184 RepID=A0A9W8DTF7_9FUNG|nr:hypothetical protein H4219_000085 [Mycoemilia scoparia]